MACKDPLNAPAAAVGAAELKDLHCRADVHPHAGARQGGSLEATKCKNCGFGKSSHDPGTLYCVDRDARWEPA